MKTIMTALLAATALVGAVSSAPASAATVFDSQALAAAAGETPQNETRGIRNYAAVVSFSADTLINQIGVFTSVIGAQDIKFLVFDSASNGGTGAVLFSQTKSFADNATQQFIYSDPFAFLFQAGHTYDIGILGSAGSLMGRWAYGATLTANGISETSNNANIANYAAPTTGGYSGVTPFIQLNTVAAVPEPASWAMMILGMGAVGFAMRRKMRVSNARFDGHIRSVTFGTAA